MKAAILPSVSEAPENWKKLTRRVGAWSAGISEGAASAWLLSEASQSNDDQMLCFLRAVDYDCDGDRVVGLF